jgi:hypothetical protein
LNRNKLGVDSTGTTTYIFVHQNVPAADAENRMIEVRQMFVETLDEMAKASADQENIADIQTFSQVIDFDRRSTNGSGKSRIQHL